MSSSFTLHLLNTLGLSETGTILICVGKISVSIISSATLVQGWELQGLVTILSPSHCGPFGDLRQYLCNVCVPSPHARVHEDHSCNLIHFGELHSEYFKKFIKIYVLNFYYFDLKQLHRNLILYLTL